FIRSARVEEEFAEPWEALTDISVHDIAESATFVADLYWKLYQSCQSEFEDLAEMARRLFRDIFHVPFTEGRREWIERETDLIQRDSGVPFLVLNLLHRGLVPE